MNPDKDHDVGWIAREECKRGHVPDGESLLVVQANHDWSVANYDAPAEEATARFAESTAAVLGDKRLQSPDWTDYQGWQYALPEAGAPTGLLREAEDDDLYFVGDWTVGEARLHAALRSGLKVGERVALSH